MSSPSLQIDAMDPPCPAGGWRTLLRAASLTGSAAVTGCALSALSTKIFAAMLGPAELAVLATLQQIRQAGVTGATLNGQTALVQGASARGGLERRLFLRTVMLMMGMAALLVTALALTLPGWVASATGLDPERAGLIRWLSATVVFSSALVFLNAVLNARGEIGRLALVQMASPAVMAILAYPVARIVRHGDQSPLAWWLMASSAAAAIFALALLNRESAKHWFRGAGPWWNARMAQQFLTMSASMLASGGVAALVLLAARARILHEQGFAIAGQFDAAWAISMNHVSLVLASLQTYCLPVLARTTDRAERSAHLTRMLTGAALIAAGMICALALLKPVALTLLYSDAFHAASRYLRWTLMGDYLKVSSWVLSIPLLAAADMRLFLAADLSAYAVFAAGAAIVGHFRGAAEGTAVGFVAMYAAHLAICGSIAWSRFEFRPGPRCVLIWATGLLAVAAVSAATWRAGG